MRELVAQREDPARKLLFAQELHEAVHAFERLQRVFRVGGIALEHLRDDRRIELESLNRRNTQQLALIVLKRFDLPLDHPPQRFRNFALDLFSPIDWQSALA